MGTGAPGRGKQHEGARRGFEAVRGADGLLQHPSVRVLGSTGCRDPAVRGRCVTGAQGSPRENRASRPRTFLFVIRCRDGLKGKESVVTSEEAENTSDKVQRLLMEMLLRKEECEAISRTP